jgi:hypothetical protein
MEIYTRLYNVLEETAKIRTISHLCIGLGYTVVVLDNGDSGVAYSWLKSKGSCTLFQDPEDYEGKPALPLLKKLFSDDLLERSIAIATVNALNYNRAAECNDDTDSLLDDLQIAHGSRVSMIGYFGPVVKKIEGRQASINAFDLGKQIGSQQEFYQNLEHNSDAVILTSTSLIHGSTEEVLAHVPEGTPCVLLGPTTPMLPEAFTHLPITILGGTLPTDNERVIRAVRHGRGTHAIQKAARKVYWKK